MELHISVNNKIANYQKRDGEIVCGNSGYSIAFTFDSEWDAHTSKTARFIVNGAYTDVDFTGDTCEVPIVRNTLACMVGVYVGDPTSPELQTTTPAMIPCKKSILCGSNKESTESYEFYANEAKEAADRAEAAAASIGDVDVRLTALEEAVADLNYKAIAITSLSVTPQTAEMGSTVTSVALSWGVNKTPTALSLDGVALNAGDTSKTVTGTFTENKTWILKATDERGAESTKTATLSFLNGVYYGVAEIPQILDSQSILQTMALSKTLRSSKLASFNVDAGTDEYIYYCLPTRMGQCSFKVGGFDGGFTLIDTIAFTNASGYTENYYIYRSDNANLSVTSVTVS